MSKKKAFVLRVHPDVLNQIEKWAQDEFRSTNGQIEWILNNALQKAGRKNIIIDDNEKRGEA